MGKKLLKSARKTQVAVLLAIGAALLAGAVLRLSFPTEIEYKADEEIVFQLSQVAGKTIGWPLVGLTSGAAIRNPPLSLWVLIGLARIAGAHDPVAFARAVAVCNILALALAFFFALRLIPEKEREAWLWAGALACASPIGLLLQRKIWAQSVLPIFCILLAFAWFRRDRQIGAFFWGFLGAILGQIHMSGFFFAGALLLWTARFGGQVAPKRKIRWGAWLSGSVVGMIPLLPWLSYLLERHGGPGEGGPHFSFAQISTLRFWADVFDDATGLQMNYSLGSSENWQWMRYPLWNGHASYIVAACSIVLALAGVRALYRGGSALARARPRIADFLAGYGSESVLFRNSALIGMGVLLTATGVYVHRHYLIVTFPLEWLWFSQLSLGNESRGRRWLAAAVIAQFALSAFFLMYIHQNHGAITGDFGTAYRFQSR